MTTGLAPIQASSLEPGPASGLPPTIYGYVWRVSRHHQIALYALSATVFLLSTIPLELQRRIVNDVIRGDNFNELVVLCLAYGAIALVMGAIKLGLIAIAAMLEKEPRAIYAKASIRGPPPCRRETIRSRWRGRRSPW